MNRTAGARGSTSRPALFLALALASPATAGPGAALTPAMVQRDLQRLVTAYEDALNRDELERFLPHLDPAFRGRMVTGDEVASPAGLRAFWDKVKRTIGRGAEGGSYRVSLVPEAAEIVGDEVLASGGTVEEIRLADGQVLRYRSTWKARLRQVDGKWVLSRLESRPNLVDAVTVAARVVASKLWPSGLGLRGPRMRRPDFDGDGTYGYKPVDP